MIFWSYRTALVQPLPLCKTQTAVTYHARFTLDHEALVLVHPADAADDVVVLVVRAAVVGVVALQ